MELNQIAELEQQLNRLKTLYEQYFMGIEKKEPLAERRQLARAIFEAAESPRNNTAVKFRAQALKNKWITFENYWNRINKEIEEGTYSRHKFKLRLHEQMAKERNKTVAATATQAQPAQNEAGAFANVISQYQQLQRQCGQSPIEPSKLLATLQKQEAQLKQKFGAKAIEFRVVLEEGKPKLKAKPIK